MARICGICPVSHLLASAKACDALLAVQIPRHRRRSCAGCMNLAQIVQSHALSFFHLSSPDLLLGMDADPAERNIFGVIADAPGARARRHPAAPVRPADHRAARRQAHPPGLGRARRRERAADAASSATQILAHAARGAGTIAERTLDLVQERARAASARRSRTFGNFPTLFMGLVDDATARLEHYDGTLRIVDADGNIVADRLDPRRYRELHRRGGRALVVPEVPLLQAAGLPGRHLPRRAAGAAERRRPLRHAAGRPGVGRVPRRSSAARCSARSTTTTRG